MSGWLAIRVRAAIAAAATLTGKRFGLFIASSLVATSAIVAAAATNQPEASPLAALLGHSLAADRTPVVAKAPTPPEPSAEPELAEEGSAEPVVHESSPEPESIIPAEPAPEPIVVPEETAPEVAPEPEPEGAPVEEPEEEAPPKPEAGRIKHVFLISLVGSGYDAAFSTTASQMPYLSGTLRPQGLLLTNYSVLSEATLPNGLATLSGQPPNQATEAECPEFTAFDSDASLSKKTGVISCEGCVYPVEVFTLGDQLEVGGFTWRAYMEGMADPTTGEPANCVYPGADEEEKVETGGYSSRLNPPTHFHSLLDLGACGTNDVPITELKKDLKSEAKTPSFSYISPDLCSAGVAGQCPEGTPTGAAAADAWLAEVVPEILESPAYKKNGLLIVTFGGVNPAEGEPVPNPLKTGAVLTSKFITKGSTDASPYTPYSLLRTSEELFGLGQLAKTNEPSVKTLAPALLGEDDAN